MHTVLAKVCQHEVSYSFSPVGHSTTLSTSKELCDSCADFDFTRRFMEYARQVYDE